jgi:polyisoprenoid-binding protein YceI
MVGGQCTSIHQSELDVQFRLLTVAGLVASTLAAGVTPSVRPAPVQQLPGKPVPTGPAKASPPSPTGATPAANATKATAAISESRGDPAPPVVYVAEGEGNRARYRVRERLAGKELDNDAVGETPKITGSIALDKSGSIVAAQSGFTADLSLLKSDQTRRDNYVRNRLLVTDSFPTTVLKVTSVKGLPSPLPTAGPTRFQLIGDLTVKGVTRPTTWDVNATVVGNQLRGSAKTRFTFKDFDLKQPTVAIVLSLADTIALEYDFVMTKK